MSTLTVLQNSRQDFALDLIAQARANAEVAQIAQRHRLTEEQIQESLSYFVGVKNAPEEVDEDEVEEEEKD